MSYFPPLSPRIREQLEAAERRAARSEAVFRAPGSSSRPADTDDELEAEPTWLDRHGAELLGIAIGLTLAALHVLGVLR